MIRAVSESELSECLKIIHAAYIPVAERFGLNPIGSIFPAPPWGSCRSQATEGVRRPRSYEPESAVKCIREPSIILTLFVSEYKIPLVGKFGGNQ